MHLLRYPRELSSRFYYFSSLLTRFYLFLLFEIQEKSCASLYYYCYSYIYGVYIPQSSNITNISLSSLPPKHALSSMSIYWFISLFFPSPHCAFATPSCQVHTPYLFIPC